MNDIIDFASRKAELDGASEEPESLDTDRVVLTCVVCNCFTHEILGSGRVICANCGNDIDIADEPCSHYLNKRTLEKLPLFENKEASGVLRYNSPPTPTLQRLIDADPDGVVLVMVAFASGQVRYQMQTDLSASDTERIEWLRGRIEIVIREETKNG